MTRGWSEPNDSNKWESSGKSDYETAYDPCESYRHKCDYKKPVKPVKKNCECECVAGIRERLCAAEFQGVTVFLNIKSLGVVAGTVLAVDEGVVKFTILAFAPIGSTALIAVPSITATLSICDINLVASTIGVTLP